MNPENPPQAPDGARPNVEAVITEYIEADPKKRECFGRYAYGSGFFLRDLAFARRELGKTKAVAFCLSCPVAQECHRAMQRMAREAEPAECKRFDDLVDEITQGFDSEQKREPRQTILMSAMRLYFSRNRRLDPFSRVMQINQSIGSNYRSELVKLC
jgi:hypothetical protein